MSELNNLLINYAYFSSLNTDLSAFFTNEDGKRMTSEHPIDSGQRICASFLLKTNKIHSIIPRLAHDNDTI